MTINTSSQSKRNDKLSFENTLTVPSIPTCRWKAGLLS